ncbi:MAG: ribosome maturation factor RimP [Firmicutes bacterium]|nr:ribosome maturation factor RimP [Bacillota bacterium]
MSQITEKVRDALESTVAELGYEIIEVEYKKKYDAYNLTVFIYNKAGISLDDCEKVHLVIDPMLDELDPTGGKPYVLNVSSPGLDRPIKTDRDYERAIETEVEVKLYAPLKGKKILEGKLIEAGEHTIKLEAKSGEISLERSKIALVRPLIKF